MTATFRASVDSPENVHQWPADYRLSLTFRLTHNKLRLETIVENVDRVSLPFGLGFHPYYKLPTADTEIVAPARSFWELQQSLPTGSKLPVDSGRDVNVPRAASALQLDDVLTDLPSTPVNSEGLVYRGRVGRVELWASPAFRELVAFTPPHRQAVCLEPYTCTTDAANLQQHGVDAGWLSLEPGQNWTGIFEMVVRPR